MCEKDEISKTSLFEHLYHASFIVLYNDQ